MKRLLVISIVMLLTLFTGLQSLAQSNTEERRDLSLEVQSIPMSNAELRTTNSTEPRALPFFEGFEETLVDWTIEDRDGDGRKWAISTSYPYEGQRHAYIFYNNSEPNNDWLISPLLALPSGLEIQLSLWARSYNASFLETFEIYVISEDGTEETRVGREENIPTVYGEYTFDLSDFAGRNVRVAIVCVSDDKWYLFVDNVHVTADGAADTEAIASTTTGGQWNTPSTWVGGVVPTEDENAVINGPVEVDGARTITNITINENGSLEHSAGFQVLHIKGDLINNGVIRNRPSTFGNLSVHAYQNIVNTGEISCHTLTMAGENDQMISGDGEFSMSFLRNSDSNSAVVTGSEVTFLGTTIDFNDEGVSGTLRLNHPLILDNVAKTTRIVIDGQNNTLHGRDRAQLDSETVVRNTILSDTLQIASQSVVFEEDVVNTGIIEHSPGFQILQIKADFVNEGIIRNRQGAFGNLVVNVFRYIVNAGEISCNTLTIAGDVNQSIEMADNSTITSQVVFQSNLDTGGPYQWKKDGVDIEGATSQNLTFTNGFSEDELGVYTSVSNGQTSRSIEVRQEAATIPTVTTNAVTNITSNSAKSGGNVTSEGMSMVTDRGVVWHTEENPTIDLPTKTDEGSGMGTFESIITDLASGTTYFVRAYAANNKGVAYGNQVSFTTLDADNGDDNFAGGDGTENNPYLIATASQLDLVRDYLSSHFKLVADVHLDITPWNQGEGWEPIGKFSYVQAWATPFEGSFDGNGYEIHGLTINRPEEDYIGLFGFVKEATFKNINIVDAEITGSMAVGILAGDVSNTSSLNIHTRGEVYSEGAVSVGGIFGSSQESRLDSSSFEGVITTTATFVGGLIGYMSRDDTLRYSYAIADVSGGNSVGGLVGEFSHNMFADENLGYITQSFSKGTVRGNNQLGGLTGRSGRFVSDSYSHVNVIRNADQTQDQIAGFIGHTGFGELISQSYSTGSVTFEGASNPVNRGFIGAGWASTENNFWDMEASGQTSTAGDASGASGRSTAEMKNKATYTDAGWDFENIWAISPSKNDGYPYLQWQEFDDEIITMPTVETKPVTDITANSAKSGGIVSMNGQRMLADVSAKSRVPYGRGEVQLQRGLVWSTSSNPNVDENDGMQQAAESGVGEFVIIMTDLLPETEYFVRAYAITEEQIVYGNEIFFTTLEDEQPGEITEALGWVVQERDYPGTMLEVHSPSISHRYAVGYWYNNGYSPLVWKSTDGGETWEFLDNVPSMANGYYRTVWFLNQNTGFIAGGNNSGGVIYKTTDGGESWTISTSVSRTVTSLQFVTNSVAYAAGGEGLLLKTTDGGENWESIQLSTTKSLSKISFVDQNTGWVAGEDGVLFKTVDGGENWTQQSFADVSFMSTNSLSAVNENVVYANTLRVLTTGLRYELYKTVDGGDSWSLIEGFPFVTLISNHFLTEDIGWQVTLSHGLYFTDDGGANWVHQPTAEGTMSYYLDMYNDTVGTLVGSHVHRTTNAGASVASLPEITHTSISLIEETTALASAIIANDGGAPITSRGFVWSTSEMPDLDNHSGHGLGGEGTGEFFVDVLDLEPGTDYYIRAYATNSVGTTYGDQLQFTTLEATSTDNEMVTEFAVYANYPNPFNPVTTIRFDIPEDAHVKLEVYNISGQRVAVLTNQVMSSGRYSVNWDASAWASGLYLYTITYQNKVTTNKMMLIK